MPQITFASCAFKKQNIPENITGDITLGQVTAPTYADTTLRLHIRPVGLNQGGVYLDVTTNTAGDVLLQLNEAQDIFEGAHFRGAFIFTLKEPGNLTDVQWLDNAVLHPAMKLCFDPCVPGLTAQTMTLATISNEPCTDCNPCA